MQDVQNIPNPDVNSTVRDDDFGSHSDLDIERPEEDIPAPTDRAPSAPIEEPPTTSDKAPVEDDETEPKRIA